jgi:hypothetical protein
MQHIKVPNTRESWVACTLGKSTLKRAFCTIILTLVRYLTSSWSIAFFSCLDVNSWHLLAGTCQVQLVCFLDSASTPSLGHSVIFPHPPCSHARAGKLPSLYGGYLPHTGLRSFLFALKTVDLFYFTQDGAVTCEWPNNRYNINFSFGIKKRPTFVAANGHQSVSCCWRAGGWCPDEKASLCINPKNM